MAKYNYSKKGLKGLTPFPFLGEVKTRVNAINTFPDTIPSSVFSTNILASSLHPQCQYVKVSKIEDHKDAKSYTLVPDKGKGTEELAFFRAGQYVSVSLTINGTETNKPYTICSSPKAALDGHYTLTIKRTNPGFASSYILDNWREGTSVKLSAPLGEFYHQEMRDSRNIIAIAGGSGITPFVSMAEAVREETEDFFLTILYGSRTKDNILLKDKLDDIVSASNGKVKVIHVLSDEEAPGCEKGFISAELIKKYAPEGDYSIYVCGPGALYDYERKEIEKLGLKKKYYRYELSGDRKINAKDISFPQDKLNKEYNLSVVIRGERKTIKTNSSEPILWAMEKAGIKAPSHCRSGECGFCHSRIISGDVYVKPDGDGRRLANKKFGWIHPCSTYALGDVEIEIFPLEY